MKLRRLAIGSVLVIGLLAASGAVAYRIYKGDPVRVWWCRVLPCSQIAGYDALCRVAAFVELTDPTNPSALREELVQEPDGASVREALDEALAMPPAERYRHLEADARDAGAPTWRCPPLARVLTSTSS